MKIILDIVINLCYTICGGVREFYKIRGISCKKRAGGAARRRASESRRKQK